ncbi:TPA: hypothetical protein R4S64_002145 [Kluyvera georgiana]|nr:hypothetical protein [Kluyvera georgiana]
MTENPGSLTDTAPGTLRLVLKCNSPGIQFAVFGAAIDPLPRRPLWNCKIPATGVSAPDFGETGVPPFRIPFDAEHPYRGVLQFILEHIASRRDGPVAHHVVHGGSKSVVPVRVDSAVLSDQTSCVPLSPLHQPFALEAIVLLLREQPEIPQIACFDTGFHRTLSHYVVSDALHPEITLHAQPGKELLVRQQVSSHLLLLTG